MADTGYRSPGTMADDAAVGTIPWANPNNAKASNNTYALAAGLPFNPTYSHYLKATNFGFAIPAGATIDGIKVQIERKPGGASQVNDYQVRIVKWDGGIGTTDRGLPGYWSTTEAYYTYGGSSDLWGETWTPARINDVDFGAALSVYLEILGIAYVDHIRIKVYYTEPSTNMKINIGDVWKDVDSIKINVGDSWKTVTKIQINIGDSWKTVFE